MNQFPGYFSGALYLKDAGEESFQSQWREGGLGIAARLVAFCASLAVFLVAVRLLSPRDIGLYAILQAGAQLLLVYAAPGWRGFVSGWRGAPGAIDQAITLAMANGYCAAGVGVAAAAVLAAGAGAADAAFVTLFLAAALLLTPAAEALAGLMERQSRTRAVAAIDLAAELAALAAAVGFMTAGFGVAGLAAGAFAYGATRFLALSLASGWRFRLAQPTRKTRAFVWRARKIRLRSFFDFLSANAAIAAVGGLLGFSAAGHFKAAQLLVSAIATAVYAPLKRIAWGAFVAAGPAWLPDRGGEDALSKQAGILLPLAIVFASPIFVGLAMIAETFAPFALGEAWRPAGAIAAILAVAALVSMPHFATAPLMTMAGKPERVTLAAAVSGIAAAVFLALFARFGPEAAALAQLAASAVGVLAAVWLQNRYVRTPWFSTLTQGASVYAGLVALVAAILGARMGLEGYAVSPLARLSIEIGAGAAAYAAIVLFVNPSYLRRTLWLD